MDAFLQKIASSMLFAKSAPAVETKKQKPVLLASGSPRSHPVRHSAPRSQQPERPRDLPRRRIAHWDKKREKCANCQHIYLKTLSQHPGFCSVDCKSNMVYLEKVNRTIRAMKDAVQEHRQQKQAEQKQTEEKQQEEPVEDEADDCLEVVETECKTFAEFGLESRILEASNVEWAFSAMY
ncbi:hypothetical protein F442_04318 [Phytophthora nicotianae P10297]|uniref:Uncharacterized protein n=5 Tax=Phytophthora nicotianae TaxID=4792 RepID=V9FAS1_PHYNI|nr:hypothetical protein F443_07722 [Phytophthora nicotianae P1569]ETL99088.1 hypothetical protein L917_04059 [Phytophthora nicotianae]ETO76903.1 hypothetical protein F444_07789 [Phytophthora nicotianae P1976]ETP50383.1 hypothetical protein F442_04318 [Phytophthora nicotianae P10297]KUG00423.1 hypothetical protein AM587_10015808 [Phytophthora nicotianae]